MKSARTAVVSWIPVVLWMGVIFLLSSIPDLKSGMQPLWDLILRKFAHAGEYAILGWLAYRALVVSGVPRHRAVAVGIVFGALYAASDEFHQTFVPGRHGAVIDATIDLFGVLFGVLMGRRRD